MSSTSELLELGKKLGYEGDALRQFIKDEQNRERDRRAEEREAEREKLELNARNEKERIQAEHEKLELNARIEKERFQREQEAEHEKLEINAHIEKEKLELERSRLENDRVFQSSKLKKPQLPAFEEYKDDLDSYLLRFERYATAQNLRKEDWALHLSTLLKGRALEVYSRIPSAEASNYDLLKNALLKRFELTEKGFREKFRSSKPEKGENFDQFVYRITNYLFRWLACGGVAKTYEAVCDFLVRDQLLAVCSKELFQYLKEKTINKSSEMAKQADIFADAHGGVMNVIVRDMRGPKESKQVNSDKTNFGRGLPQNQKSELVRLDQRAPRNQDRQRKQCFSCGEWGHMSSACPKRKKDLPKAVGVSYMVGSSACVESNKNGSNQNASNVSIQCEGLVNGVRASVLRDTGCNTVVVKQSLVRPDQYLGETVSVRLMDNTAVQVPTACVHIETPYLTGTVTACCVKRPLYDLMVGNIEGVANFVVPGKAVADVPTSMAVETRSHISKSKKSLPKLKVPDAIPMIDKKALIEEQNKDESLSIIRNKAASGEVMKCKGGGSYRFKYRNNVLHREHTTREGRRFTQVVVPRNYRPHVLKLAQESTMGGHLGSTKTKDRVCAEFHWSGAHGDVTRYCRSCDICQKTQYKGKVKSVPIGKMPLIETPFKRVAIDIVGPLSPLTDRKNRYILTMVDYATRYPEAVALPSIETERVAEALVEMFSRLGIPEEILTDCGSQFTSELMAEVNRLLSIKQLWTTPYHPMCNGLVEKFNGTLKQMLRRMCAERPNDWDRYLHAVLFAYREVPQESLGFSPFELLYGRTVRGPMKILRQLWSDDETDDEIRTTYQYVCDLKDKLRETCAIAHETLRQASNRAARYYNSKARDRKFKKGDRVLVLLPTERNKLMLQWKGPYTIIDEKGGMDYTIDVGGKSRMFHANLLKRYYDRTNAKPDQGILNVVGVAIIEEDEEQESVPDLNLSGLLECNMGKTVFNMSPDLTEKQRKQAQDLINDYPDVFSNKPGKTDVLEHGIKLTSHEPFRGNKRYGKCRCRLSQ